MENYENAAQRRHLAKEWVKLSSEEKVQLRASRARMGIKCDKCGTVGYFIENCINGCNVKVEINSSSESHLFCEPTASMSKSPVGVFWGSNINSHLDLHHHTGVSNNIKVDINTVKKLTSIELQKLKETDSNLEMFQYFTEADEGYYKTYPQLTLHQVMRRIMRILERKLNENVHNLENEFDKTLLHPPLKKIHKHFYSTKLSKIDKFNEYFIDKEVKQNSVFNHNFHSSVRPIDELDILFRGTSSTKKNNSLFKPCENPGFLILYYFLLSLLLLI
jgi:hypothetical protein